MNNNLDQEVETLLNNKLKTIAISSQALTSFVTFKKEFHWLAKQFDKQLEKFYLNDISEKSKSINLPKSINDEIKYYFWIKAKNLVYLKNNLVLVQKKLQNLNSNLLHNLNTYEKLFNKSNYNSKALFNHFLNQWENLIIERAVNYKLHETLALRQKYLLQWTNNILVLPEIKNLVNFAWNFFGKFWDGDFADLKAINLDIIIKYANLLEQNPAILKIAEMLGRGQGKSEFFKIISAIRNVINYISVPIANWPEEIAGITFSKELNNIVPLELVNIILPKLNPIFYKHYNDSKISTLEFISSDLIAIEKEIEVETKQYLPDKQGPIIICVDTSKSMKNNPEVIAKATILAVARIALEAKRPCYMINFSGVFEAYDLSSLRLSVSNLVHFLAYSFGGQTNINPVLDHVLDIMTTKNYQNADLLVISDFMCSDLTESQISKIKKRQQQDYNRFYALNIAPVALKNNWANCFDDFFNYDPSDPWAMKKILLKMVTKNK